MRVKSYVGKAIGVVLGLSGACLSMGAKWPGKAIPFARAVLSPKSGSDVSGTVEFAKDKGELLVRAQLENLPAGKHGFHIHEKGDCTAQDASSAGEHYNPTRAPHGGPGHLQHHAGDFGNITADKSGTEIVEMAIKTPPAEHFPDWQDIVGKSIILHEKMDDLKSQPSGNSGKRIACGVIEHL